MRAVIGFVAWLFLLNVADAQVPNTALDSFPGGGGTTPPTADRPVAPGFPNIRRHKDGSHWLYPTADRNDYDGTGDGLPPVSSTDAESSWLVQSNTAEMGTETDLNLIFIDRSTNMVWPAPGKAAILNKGSNAFSVRCKLGERVCYSIYTKNGAQSWGLQPHSSCQQCCAICGDGGVNIPILSASTIDAQNGNPSSPADAESNSSVPTHTKPTLLETVYFLRLGHEVTEQNRVEGTKDYGRVVIRQSSRLVEDDDDKLIEEGTSYGTNYRWTFTALKDCGVQIDWGNQSNPINASEVYFFNNVVPGYETGFDPVQERPKITLRGGVDENGKQEPAVCEHNANGNVCHASNTFWAQDSEQLIRFERAINYIYSKFCTASGHLAKPF
jgi:hypothetical protein